MEKQIIDTITARDYVDFNQTYSEKNVINMVTGEEFIIGDITSKKIQDIDTQKDEEREVTHSESDGYSSRVSATEVNLNGVTGTCHLREEYKATPYTITIVTDEIITDPNSINVELVIDYKKFTTYEEYYSENSIVNSGNYNSSTSAFYRLLNNQSFEQLSAINVLPYAHASVEAGGTTHELSRAFPTNYGRKYVQKRSDGKYVITLRIQCVDWWGYNTMKASVDGWLWDRRIVKHDCYYYLMAATKITFKVTATSVNASEISFSYEREIGLESSKGRSYELETNEFLQTTLDETTSEKQSKKVADKILEAYSFNRPIISFTLLNCKKYIVNGEERYLRAEDLIYLKDENDKFLQIEKKGESKSKPAVFEVLKTRPIWEGGLTMEVVCQQTNATIEGFKTTVTLLADLLEGETLLYDKDGANSLVYLTVGANNVVLEGTSLKVFGSATNGKRPVATIKSQGCWRIVELTSEIESAEDLLDYSERTGQVTISVKFV